MSTDPRPKPSDTVIPADMDDLRPAVARGSVGAPWLAIGGALLLGLLVIFWLSAKRQDAARKASGVAETSAPGATIPSPVLPTDLALVEAMARTPPPPIAAPVEAAPTIAPPPPPPPPAPARLIGTPVPPPPVQDLSQRGRAPALVIDLAPSGPSLATGTTATLVANPLTGSAIGQLAALAGGVGGLQLGAGGPGGAGGLGGLAAPNPLNSDEQFAQRTGAAEPESARATMLRNQPSIVPQGAMIPAVLETALNSDLPGFARAVVSRDVRGFDGSTVLIPRGSRVIGQYRSGVAQGASRAFVIWTRILRPDGGSIQIASSGADTLGRAGLEGEVDRHFFQRFGGSILLSVIDGAVSALTSRPSTQVVIGSSQDASGLAASAIGPQNISPTIKVPQGSPIRIFVARDLDFSPVQAGR